jgi:hypothetical protein
MNGIWLGFGIVVVAAAAVPLRKPVPGEDGVEGS